MASRYIIVNYHYIRPERIRGFHPCTEEHFREQIAHLRERYTIIPLQELYEHARDHAEGRFCAFTFDDGLREHYEFVLPVFLRYGITGSFFPIGMTLEEKRVSHTHKLHVLLSKMETADIARLFHDFFEDSYRISDTKRINPRRRFDDILTSNLKETLIRLAPQKRNAFIDDVFKKTGGNEKILAEKLFMTSDEVRRLYEEGMTIGFHGYCHVPFDVMDAEEQRQDLVHAIQTIVSITGESPDTFSYPNGRYNEDALLLLRAHQVKIAVILGAKDVSGSLDPLLLPRYDTNDVFSL
ncbi:MAG: polysaccharide deacetylase family protein [Candidatus Niyogibacteria bacterium]|nr:polysaccharide deacetylase family protein [Candidatus Niyogibacteria bacterium]